MKLFSLTFLVTLDYVKAKTNMA